MGDEKTIYMGADHAGYNLKNYLKIYLAKAGYNIIDMGSLTKENC